MEDIYFDEKDTAGVSEKSLELFPPDSYVGEVYWADLPFKERSRWMMTQQVRNVCTDTAYLFITTSIEGRLAIALTLAEDNREWSYIWSQFLKDPLWPLATYAKNFVLPGMGLFTEGYVLFSIGNLKTLYQVAYPSCWKTFTSCSETLTQTTDYFQIVGIIIGQVGVGFLGDWIGRRYGLIQDAVIMFLGVFMLTVSDGPDLKGWVIMYAISQLVYGVGVGGEYPMTGTITCEVAVPGIRADKLHRGRTVVLAFLMQGWGQLVNIGVLILSLLVFNGRGGPPYAEVAAGATWRFSFAFIGVFVLWLLYYRVYRMGDVDKTLHSVQRMNKVSGFDKTSQTLLWTFYWHRMIGTAGGWFCNDFMFYGNKIFQGDFIKVLTPAGASVVENWLWAMVNVGCQLAGYYAAALTIDYKFFGRVRMQALGFIMDFIHFIIPAALYTTLVKPANIGTFQFLYFFSSFWNQFGPNCTTFLLAAEVYPASIRATGHGVSAGVGKLGALLPTVLYNYIPSSQTRFWIVCWFGLAGFILTLLFIPDTTGLDLREQERRWRYIREGRPNEYHGIAIHPRHLSFFETAVLGLHKQYDPSLDDREERIAALQQLTANSTHTGVPAAAGTVNEHLTSEV